MLHDYATILPEARYKAIKGEKVEISTLKQTLQKLKVALSQINAGNTYKNLLNETWQIIYSLY